MVDQGLSFDVTTLMGRRQMLRALGFGAAAVGLAACSGTTTATTGSGIATSGATSPSGGTVAGLTEIPDETAGPYPGNGSNGSDVLEESGIVRPDIRSSIRGASGTAEGVPMTLEVAIRDLANRGVPFAGVAVYVWHCDREGRYCMYTSGVLDENYLRGVQIADDSGVVRFTSIFPACYFGRWPHIHFEVYPDESSFTDVSSVMATSQVALLQGSL